jgi:hypothetical protein
MALSHSKSPPKNPAYKRGNFALFLIDFFTLNSDPIGQTLGMAGLQGPALARNYDYAVVASTAAGAVSALAVVICFIQFATTSGRIYNHETNLLLCSSNNSPLTSYPLKMHTT